MSNGIAALRSRLIAASAAKRCLRCYTQTNGPQPLARDGESQPAKFWAKFDPKKNLPGQLSPALAPTVTRFAPSPTGYLHMGSLRTALYNYLFAKNTKGKFILRVEDTDQARTVQDAEKRLMDDLRWATIEWDEGPDKGGPSGPYRQSERLHHYHEHASRLIDTSQAYRCFCTAKTVDLFKQESDDGRQSSTYPGTCRSISKDESDERAAKGEEHVVRFKSRKATPFVDMVYGRYTTLHDEGDFIIVKRDGFPTYHFANVVDDHLMGVTHVIRGAEWLISTPKHVSLYESLGWAPPTFGHVGLLFTADNQKLSKRDKSLDLSGHREKLIVPQALNNWVALLGCRLRDEATKSEVFTDPDGLAKNFTPKFTKGNIGINPSKLMTFQVAHAKAMIQEPAHTGRATKYLLQPLYQRLIRLDITRPPSGQVPLAAGDERTLDAANLGDLVPALATEALALPYLRSILSSNEKRYPDGITIIHEHPYLFWTPSEAHYRSGAAHLHQLEDSTNTQAPTSHGMLTHFARELEALPGKEWTSERIGSLLSGVVGSVAHLSERAAYNVLRVAVAGDCIGGSWATKRLLPVLGKEETMRRFKILERTMVGERTVA